MRKLGMFAALALSGMISSCAERIVNPTVIPKSRPQMEARREAERITEDTRKHSTARSRQVSPSDGVKPGQPPQPPAPPSPVFEQPRKTRIWREPSPAEVLLRPPQSDESNFPFAALMPPPPEPAEPTFPSAPPNIELPPPPEAVAPVLPEVPIEAAMPAPPEPVEPSLPATALPPPPALAEPSLPPRIAQEEIATESPISIPFPDLSTYLSLRPHLDWVDTVGAIEVPRSPLSEALEISEERIPSLIRNPWPLSLGAPISE
jgi:hypothetical protein